MILPDPLDSDIELSAFQRFMRRERARARRDSEEFIRNCEIAREALERGFRCPPEILRYFGPNGEL